MSIYCKRRHNSIPTSGSILYQAVATGDHLACVLPRPLTACASNSISYICKKIKLSNRTVVNFNVLHKVRKQQHKKKFKQKHNCETTCPGPSFDIMILGVTVIGLFANSGNVSWLVVNDVYVFGFTVGSEVVSVGRTYSLPNGNHCRS